MRDTWRRSIEKQLENGGGSSSERQTDRAMVGMEPPSIFDSTKLQQDSPFSFHGNKAEDTSEKVEFTAEKKSDAAQGATSASFSFGKKIESSVLGSLSSGSLTGFSFSAGSSSLFGKDAAQSKAASSLFSAKASESPAGGGSSECRGEHKASASHLHRANESATGAPCPVCVTVP